MMEFQEDLETSATYLRQAVRHMMERGIPPTPYNYALWYAHAQNRNPALSKELLEQFPVAGRYDADKSESLFFEHFIKDYLPNSPKAQNLLANLLSQLAGTVARNLKGSRKYGNSLRETMTVLSESNNQAMIQEALAQLLADTRAVEKLNREFQYELQSATQEVAMLRKELEESRNRALRDALTNIPNRRAFNEAIARALSDPARPTSLLLLDLDHFKVCNDTYGHPMGDRVLETLGKLLTSVESETVFVARYGGEEFAIIARHPIGYAQNLAERLRQDIAAIRIRAKSGNQTLSSITASIGIARAAPGENAAQLIERADAALYQAKHQGRNRVVAAP
ncbi:MAG: diguanylate cyclase [Chromatiaceae bacterium]|nr:diguanylate cyclase [Chromatiaceae bacterium]